jgi:hypothetical protein
MGGNRAAGHFRDTALFLNLHVLNKPEYSGRIFQNPSPFDLETGDLTNPFDIDLATKVLEGLVAWTARIAPK